MFAPCTEPSWYSSSSGQKVLMRIVNFCCLLGNKQVSLFPKLCSSLHPAPLLRTTYMLSRATQACSAVRLQHTHCLNLTLLAHCRPAARLPGPPAPRRNVVAPTAELTKDRRSVGGLAVVVWSLLRTAPGRRPWTLTETS